MAEQINYLYTGQQVEVKECPFCHAPGGIFGESLGRGNVRVITKTDCCSYESCCNSFEGYVGEYYNVCRNCASYKKKEPEPLTMEDLAGAIGYALTGVIPENWKEKGNGCSI